MAASARLARDLGITIYTVALGTDADEAMLKAVAGSSSRFFRAVPASGRSAFFLPMADFYRNGQAPESPSILVTRLLPQNLLHRFSFGELIDQLV